MIYNEQTFFFTSQRLKNNPHSQDNLRPCMQSKLLRVLKIKKLRRLFFKVQLYDSTSPRVFKPNHLPSPPKQLSMLQRKVDSRSTVLVLEFSSRITFPPLLNNCQCYREKLIPDPAQPKKKERLELGVNVN